MDGKRMNWIVVFLISISLSILSRFSKLGAYVVPRPSLPVVTMDQILAPEPMAILATRSHQLRSRLITQVLVQWQGESKRHATWESLFALQ